MLIRQIVSLLILVGLTGVSSGVRAGACTEGDDSYYVAEIAKLARKARLPSSGDDPFYCLDLHLGMTNRWAGPRAAKEIKRLRRSPHRKRLARVCGRIITQAARRREYAQSCVQLLAAYGVRQSKGKSTYKLAAEFFKYGLDFQHLAALGDLAAVPELLRRFRQTRACQEVWRDGKATHSCIDFARGEKNRWTRKAHREHKIGVINALWHLAPASVRPFLMEVSRADPVALVRARAKRVLARVNEVHAKSAPTMK